MQTPQSFGRLWLGSIRLSDRDAMLSADPPGLLDPK